MSQPFWVYILVCSDESFYVGQTDDINKRMSEHICCCGCDYTKKRLPVKLAWATQFASRDEAKEAERQIKGWSRLKKKALVEGKFESLPLLSSRSKEAIALRDALQSKAPQGRGK